MKQDPQNNKSEFDWEKEIRKDEARINSYLKELPNFIDLPNEEEMIMKKLQKHPELIPQNVDWENISFSEIFDDFDDDFFFSDDWQKKEGADVYILLEKLAYQWGVVFASALKKEEMPAGLAIICLFGKILARTADILDLDQAELPNLKIALCKRIAADINKLSGDLKALSERYKKLSSLIDNHQERLQTVREKILDILEKTRQLPGSNDSGNKTDK
jgi:hypothetical protein